jgi:hypothetical protein
MLKMEDWRRKVVSRIPGIGVGRSAGLISFIHSSTQSSLCPLNSSACSCW